MRTRSQLRKPRRLVGAAAPQNEKRCTLSYTIVGRSIGQSRPEYADFERQAGQERFSPGERAIDVALLRAINLRCSRLAIIIAPVDPRSVITREPADF